MTRRASRKPRRRRHSAETRARIAEGVRASIARRREAARVRPRDLERLRREHQVAEHLRPLLEIADAETAEIIGARGGPEEISAQERILAEDVGWLGLTLRALLWSFTRNPDPEVASRIATVAGARRSNLVALGLGRRARELDPTQPVELLFDEPESAPAQAGGQG